MPHGEARLSAYIYSRNIRIHGSINNQCRLSAGIRLMNAETRRKRGSRFRFQVVKVQAGALVVLNAQICNGDLVLRNQGEAGISEFVFS